MSALRRGYINRLWRLTHTETVTTDNNTPDQELRVWMRERVWMRDTVSLDYTCLVLFVYLIYLSIYLSPSLYVICKQANARTQMDETHPINSSLDIDPETKHVHRGYVNRLWRLTHKNETPFGLKVPCSYLLTAIGQFALLRYLSEFQLIKGFVVLILGNSKSNHLGAQGTFKGSSVTSTLNPILTGSYFFSCCGLQGPSGGTPSGASEGKTAARGLHERSSRKHRMNLLSIFSNINCSICLFLLACRDRAAARLQARLKAKRQRMLYTNGLLLEIPHGFTILIFFFCLNWFIFFSCWLCRDRAAARLQARLKAKRQRERYTNDILGNTVWVYYLAFYTLVDIFCFVLQGPSGRTSSGASQGETATRALRCRARRRAADAGRTSPIVCLCKCLGLERRREPFTPYEWS